MDVNTEINHQTPEFSIGFSGPGEQIIVETEPEIGPEVQLWDDFSPALYELTAYLAGIAVRLSRGAWRKAANPRKCLFLHRKKLNLFASLHFPDSKTNSEF